MGNVDKAVLLARPGRPSFHHRTFNFDGATAVAADEVVVVFAAGAAAVTSLAVIASKGVELAGVGQGSHLVVDGSEGDVLPLGLELGVKFLGRAEPVGSFQNGGQGALLPG